MADDRRFLIGRGEQLTETVTIAKNMGDKFHPYSFAVAKKHITPQARSVSKALADLPQGACPGDQAVAVLTLHPSYLAKGYYPAALLRAAGLHSIGSRTATVRTRNGTERQKNKSLATAELYVAGTRKRFDRWADDIKNWTEDDVGAIEIRQVEDLYAEKAEDRVRNFETLVKIEHFEAVLHMTGNDKKILSGFEEYVRSLEGKVRSDKRQQIGGLCFLPITVAGSRIEDVAKFAFLRGVRQMPEMRSFVPLRAGIAEFVTELPDRGAVNTHLRVAVLDGGLPARPDLSRWANAIDAKDVGAEFDWGLRHGLGVTSALLFGSLKDGNSAGVPFSDVEHHRIADAQIQLPDFYDLIPRVEAVLKAKRYDYVNISMGPAVNVDDSLVNVWTAKLDELLADGKTLAFLAAGNTGREKERIRKRIGPPADAVNAITVGACDTTDHQWDKATYSSIGPGRSCGIVKPDVLAFGGDHNEQFGMLVPGLPVTAGLAVGTSFACPLAMRVALGIAAHFGYALHPLAVKALLIHHAMRQRHHLTGEVGWGRIPHNYADLVSSTADSAQIVYQGILKPGKYLRAAIPVPHAFGQGPVHITATICFTTETEPQNTVSYTRAGLEVFFRPHASRRKLATKQHADTASFFKASDLRQPEGAQRVDALKWETTLKKSRRFDDPSALSDPAFDLHYVAREDGANAKQAKPIPYSMVVTVRQKGFDALYDSIVQRYRGVLEPLAPTIGIPIRIMPGESQPAQ